MAKAKKTVVKTAFHYQVKTNTTIFARTRRLVQMKKEDEDNTTRFEGIVHVKIDVIITILITIVI